MSERPRFVPKGRRGQRFHGAFTGGFSVGYFNSVGSKEGWKPREESGAAGGDERNDAADNNSLPSSRKRSRPQQKLEDFMDDQDHDQWGGPSSLRRDYRDPRAASTLGSSAARARSAESAIENWMKVTVEPPVNVGNKLLRVLGWRDGNSSSAYVPAKDSRDNSSETGNLHEGQIILGTKRWRKIKLQQDRVKIPPPKIDTCGLGFEPYQNAPEFKAYREKRRQQAQQRAQLGQRGDVYRVSNIFRMEDANNNDMDEERNRQSTNDNRSEPHHDNNDYVSYETIEEFVGSKSVGGFALHDDADDAYDDETFAASKGSGKVKLDKEQYNNEIYEHDSDDDGNQFTSHARRGMSSTAPTTNASFDKESDLAGVLSSFAGIGSSGGTSNGGQNPKSGVAADGRQPMSGFVLGGAFTSHSTPKRYRGPDVPLSYDAKRHDFGPDENPLVLKALSHAVQLEVVDAKRQQALDEALRANASSNTPSRLRGQTGNTVTSGRPPQRSNAAMAGGAFAGLAEAMRNRFTSVVDKTTMQGNQPEAGLRMPMKGKNATPTDETDRATKAKHNKKQKAASKEIKIRRTVLPFSPHRLLCKRFHVPVPVNSTHVASAQVGRTTEASYFQKEILSPAAAAAGRDRVRSLEQPSSKSENIKRSVSGLTDLFDPDGIMKDDAVGTDEQKSDNRPSSEIYKSIFEPQSDEGEDSGSEEAEKAATSEQSPNKREEANNNKGDMEAHESKKESDSAAAADEERGQTEHPEEEDKGETALVQFNGREKKKRKRRKERKRRSDSGSDQDSDGRSHRRRRHKKKRSRSVSSDSTDLSRDSGGTDHRSERKLQRDRKEKRKHKSKKKKKSKRR